MIKLIYFFPLLFVTNPILWKNQIINNKKKFLKQQFLRIVFSILYYCLINYIFLIEHTIYGFISYMIWPISIIHISDSIQYNKEKKSRYSFIFGFSLILFIITLYLILPLISTKNLYNIVNSQITYNELEGLNDLDDIIIIPLETAKNKSEKLLNKINNVYYKIGKFSIKNIENEIYWIAPVEFNGFAAYKSQKIVSYYIKVSAENPDKDAILIKDNNMQFVPSAYFNNDILRLVHNKYNDIAIMGYSFEINEEGKPYYVITYGHYYNYRYGEIINGIILINPETGEMDKYSLNNIPDFVDNVIPEKIAKNYNTYYENYEHGLINNFINTEKYSLTEWDKEKNKLRYYYLNNNIYWVGDYTDNSNLLVGYSLLNIKTGEFVYLNEFENMCNSKTAIELVNEIFSKNKWVGTMPLLYNIYGEYTWLIPIVDDEGNFKQISLVHAISKKIAYSETKKQALINYEMLILNEKLNNIKNTEDITTINGTIYRINKITTQLGDLFVVLLENNHNIYTINSNISPYISLAEIGDNIQIKIINKNNHIIVKEFYNKTLDKYIKENKR